MIEIVFRVLAAIAYIVTIYFAVSAFFFMKKQTDDIRDIQKITARTAFLLMAMKLKSDQDQLNEMKRVLEMLIEEEHFEDAERMKKAIQEQAETVRRQVDMFKEHFGDVAELNITNVKI